MSQHTTITTSLTRKMHSSPMALLTLVLGLWINKTHIPLSRGDLMISGSSRVSGSGVTSGGISGAGCELVGVELLFGGGGQLVDSISGGGELRKMK
jgi:hypothetical protein